MASRQELQVQKKREQETREESTIPARVFVPSADIYETQDALTVIWKCPVSSRVTSMFAWKTAS